MAKKFKFAMGAAVMLATSLDAFEAQQAAGEPEEGEGQEIIEAGVVIGQSPNAHGSPVGENTYPDGTSHSFLVRYRSSDGHQVEDWFSESSIVDDPRGPQEPDISPGTAGASDV